MVFTHQFEQHLPRTVPGCFKRTKRLLKRKEVLMYSLPCSCNVTFSVGINGLGATHSVGSWEEHIFGFGMSCRLGEKYKQQHHNQKISLKIPNCNIYAVFLFTLNLRVSSGYKKKIKNCLLTPSFLPSCGIQRECWAARASASSSCRWSWPCAPCDRVYGKTDQTNPVQRRERGMEDERKSSRMRGWNGCTHKEGKRWENNDREGKRMPWWWRRQSGFLHTVLDQNSLSFTMTFTSWFLHCGESFIWHKLSLSDRSLPKWS